MSTSSVAPTVAWHSIELMNFKRLRIHTRVAVDARRPGQETVGRVVPCSHGFGTNLNSKYRDRSLGLGRSPAGRMRLLQYSSFGQRSLAYYASPTPEAEPGLAIQRKCGSAKSGIGPVRGESERGRTTARSG